MMSDPTEVPAPEAARPTGGPRPAGQIPANRAARAEWLFYDGSCRFCAASVRRWRSTLERQGIGMAPLQAPWVHSIVGPGWDEMKVLTRDDRLLGGIHAALHVARRVPWLRPITWLAILPGVTPLLGHAYRFIAARRHCIAGSCPIDTERP